MTGFGGGSLKVIIFVFSLLIIYTLLSLGEGKTETPQAVIDYNIVLVVIDTLRADHLLLYGYGRDVAPFLNELAGRSVVFENTYSPSSWTAPATASIMTSMYPFQHGVLMGMDATKRMRSKNRSVLLNRIPEGAQTLAEALKMRGYRTYCVADNLNIVAEEGFTQGFDRFHGSNYKNASFVNSKLLEWRDDVVSGGRYFLYIHYMDPHLPRYERQPWFGEDTRDIPTCIRKYDSEISYTDDKLREVFSAYGWGQDTLVIVTSDHGEAFGENNNWFHGYTLYGGEINVPLIIHMPGQNASSVVSERVSTIDLLPTLRDYVGLPESELDEGVSLMPLMDGGSIEDRCLYSYLVRDKDEHKDLHYEAAICGRWKYINKVGEHEELFYITGDPKETTNVIGGHPDTAAKLKASYDGFEQDCFKYPREFHVKTYDNETLEKLKSLGYVH